jgi:hypothetical protein
VRFQVLTEASRNTTAFQDIAPCSFFEVNLRFGGACCLHHQDVDGGSTLICITMEPVFTSQTSVYFNKTTRCYIPECCNLHTLRMLEIRVLRRIFRTTRQKVGPHNIYASVFRLVSSFQVFSLNVLVQNSHIYHTGISF